jgi:hypothetical protein
MKINNIFYAFVIFCGMIFTGCDKFLDPMPEQRLSEENMIANPVYAEGLLLRAYKQMPINYDFVLDVAADDAVNNKPGSAVNTMVTGGWTSSNTNQTDNWGKSYEMFFYIHKFMEMAPKVEWDWRSNERDSLFAMRLIGEAFALRAFWGFELLKSNAGVAGTQLLGYPIVTKVLSDNDNLKLPRNTYTECINQIIKDLDLAIVKLPLTWTDKTGLTNAIYNETMGARYTNRINGLTAKLLKSRVLLYAASPAFSASGFTWSQAAEAAAAVMVDKGGLTDITAAKVSDLEFYKDLASKEILWASARVTNQTGWATTNYPPSLYGKGETNPTQNFVEAFSKLDGTPFDPKLNNTVTQYTGRDPRLAKYVVYNGLTFRSVLMMFADDPANINAPGRNENGTLSGYYLKKFINEGVIIDPGKPTVGKDQFYTYARYTEALLNFAEAANEAVGPDVAIKGYTARNVINAIRTRAGITSTAYINGLNQAGLRQAIKNERRIELCFEGHRFWDIRRWNDIATMKSSVSGVKFSSDNKAATVSEVQIRDYKDYQIYGPIPYNETLKYDIKQNNGWQ